MWKRSNLKANAKLGVKRNYWKTVLVSLVMAIVVGGFAAMCSFGGAYNGMSSSNVTPDSNVLGNLPVDAPQSVAVASAVPPVLWVILGVFAVLVVAFAIFSAIALINPFSIGSYKYSLNALRGEGNISDLGNGFDVSYKRNVKTMFFYDLYLFLWTMLFVIPGVVKSFEYRMVPYILADNPDMDKKEVFALSKSMMKGNKWRAFVLDLSFILWDFLNAITLGIVGIFWVSPYKLLTNAALYDTLKENN